MLIPQIRNYCEDKMHNYKANKIDAICAMLAVVTIFVITNSNSATAQTHGTISSQSSVIIVENLTLRDLHMTLEKEGYTADVDKKGLILWKIDGYKTLLTINGTGDSLLFASIMKGGNATLRKINDWNRNARFSRASMDDEGNALLFVDLDLSGGVTHDRIKDYLRTCRSLFQEWIRKVLQ
jgi:hypothetical protein